MKFEIRNLKWGLLAFAIEAFGADVTLTVNPPIISLGEAAQVQVEVRDAKRTQAPDFPAVDGLRFSGTGQSSQTRIINGKMDKSVAYTVNVYPQRTGEFTIGPFNYKVDGEIKRLNGKLKVVATSGDATAAQSWDDLIFAKLTSSREKAYVQEPFELTLSIYSRPGLQINGVENLRGMPETGLSSETEWKGESPTREYVDGTLYEVRRFRASMRAIGSGTFEFAPSVTARVVSPRQRQPARDPFFGGMSLFNSVETTPIDLQAEPVTVTVQPLPTLGKPESFSGAVGRFQFQVTADPKNVSPGDPITLQMTIVGEGNYDRIQPPALPVDAPFRLFGDAVRQQGNNGVRFEQVISPRDADVTEIPPLEFSFFDTDSGSYRTLSSTPIPITVNASSNNTAQLFAAKESIQTAPVDTPFASESDIQRMTGWLKEKWKQIHPWLWTVPAALGAGLLIFLVQKFYHWRRKDTAWVRRQQAPKAARKGLKAASIALRKNDPSAFYEALGNALSDYFGHRLNLPPGDVTPATVIAALERAGADTKTLRSIFDQVEAARYGMAAQKPADEMRSLITSLEQVFRLAEKTNL